MGFLKSILFSCMLVLACVVPHTVQAADVSVDTGSQVSIETSVLDGISGTLKRVINRRAKSFKNRKKIDPAATNRGLTRELRGARITFRPGAQFSAENAARVNGTFSFFGNQSLVSRRRGLSVRSGVRFFVEVPQIGTVNLTSYQKILLTRITRIRVSTFNNGRTTLRLIGKDSEGQRLVLVYTARKTEIEQECAFGYYRSCSPAVQANSVVLGGDSETCSCEPVCQAPQMLHCIFSEFENGPCQCLDVQPL